MGLLGPPELHAMEAAEGEEPPKPETTGDKFIDLMVSNFNKPNLPGRLKMGFTEKNSYTYLTSGDPCLDFFFHVIPGKTAAASLNDRLSLAWAHNPSTTLKLVANLRGLRGTGKSDEESFHAAALWLFKNHPRTLAANVAALAEFGSLRDLPEILYRLLEGLDVRNKQKDDRMQKKINAKGSGLWFPLFRRRSGRKDRKNRAKIPREIRVSAAEARAKAEKEKARVGREEKRLRMAKKVIERYNKDFDFRFLYEKISDHFAELLKSDIDRLNSGDLLSLSSAAKHCPSLDSSYDRSTLLCEGIAKKMFPLESLPEFAGIEESHHAYRARNKLNKQVLVPLRKALRLPETFIAAKQWDQIPYGSLSSGDMKFYKEKFLKNDGKRFAEFLKSAAAGEVEISPADSLFPHCIIESLNDKTDSGLLAEAHWIKTVRELLAGKNPAKRCLAVCDVSESMRGQAVEAAVALGLLLSEVSADPWKGKVLTFDESPELHRVEGDDLMSKTESLVKNLRWGKKQKDLQKVFDLILQVAASGGLPEEEMVKRVVVFSDMEFEKGLKNGHETDYDVIVRKFRERGYGGAVPEIVFWKVRESKSTPVPATQRGAALVSGFSKNLMRVVLDESVSIHPMSVMEAAISGEEYHRLEVVDK